MLFKGLQALLWTFVCLWTVSLENWRTAAEVSVSEVVSDPANIEVCTCSANHLQAKNIVDLTFSSDDESADAITTTTSTTEREEVLSPSGWLSDSVTAAAQLLILQ